MAQKTQRQLSHIENFFSMLLAKHQLADFIIIGELPPTTNKEWESFVNVDVGQQYDYGAYSSGFVNIYLYARPTGSPPRKNVKELERMERILDDIISKANDRDYTIYELYRDSGYDTNRQFHYNIISVSVIAK